MPVGLGDRADRDLPYLRAAAHDDHALAVDHLQRRDLGHLAHDRQRPQLRDERVGILGGGDLDLEVDAQLPVMLAEDLDERDVALSPGDGTGELVQHAHTRIHTQLNSESLAHSMALWRGDPTNNRAPRTATPERAHAQRVRAAASMQAAVTTRGRHTSVF